MCSRSSFAWSSHPHTSTSAAYQARILVISRHRHTVIYLSGSFCRRGWFIPSLYKSLAGSRSTAEDADELSKTRISLVSRVLALVDGFSFLVAFEFVFRNGKKKRKKEISRFKRCQKRDIEKVGKTVSKDENVTTKISISSSFSLFVPGWKLNQERPVSRNLVSWNDHENSLARVCSARFRNSGNNLSIRQMQR